MQLILVGYGKMNRLVETLAAEQGHRIARIIRRPADWNQGWSPGLVAVDFSVPQAVIENLERALAAGIPVVLGTTGWLEQLERVRRLVESASVGVVYGANFSIGVQWFYRILAEAARRMPAGYEPYLLETHHRQKRDAPSGTARHLAGLLAAAGHPAVSTASLRAGSVPGTHTVGFESADDSLSLTHTARSRRGFAAGALAAAQWILGRRGLHEFGEVLDDAGASSNPGF